jgi:rhodanese-related sulfurtransferase
MKHMRLLQILTLIFFSQVTSAADYKSPGLAPEAVYAKLGSEEVPMVIDVRKPAEFKVGHIPGAINIPVDELEVRIDEINDEQGVLVYCINGSRTRLAETILLDNGIENIYHLEGAFYAWIQSGLEHAKGSAR